MCKDQSMYKTDFSCTYHQEDTTNDNTDDNERYQSDMLRAFCLEEYNDDVVRSVTQYLCGLVTHLPNKEHVAIWKQCTKTAASLFLSEDMEVGFMVLFSYDFFYATHDCLCATLCHDDDIDTKLKRMQEALASFKGE